MKINILLICLVVLAGCAHLDEGTTDYRKGDIQTDTSPTVVLLKKYQKSSDPYRRIFKNDSISIHLQQAFIKDFHETAFFTKEENIKGEIAVVVKVFELIGGKDFDFSGRAAEDGRVVFYSPDVRKGQFLNFSAMPIYGPITYNGNPLAFDFYIIELDSADERTKDLLHTLATAGSTAYPPASPILNILDLLGGALLKGNKNDQEFRYSMVLYPDKGYQNVSQAVLEVANYVFVREEDRRKQTKWSQFVLDEKSGRLFLSSETNKELEFRDNTYFVVQINKGFDATNLDLAQNTFGKLLTKLDQENADKVNQIKSVLDGFLIIQSQTKKFSKLKSLLNDLEAMPREQANRKRTIAYDFVTGLADEIKNTGDQTKKDNLATDQIDYLLDNLKRLVSDNLELYAKINRQELKDNKEEVIKYVSSNK
ncbi:MAG: hypothetical protein D4R88_06940 [Methanosarcinales archaeon]|nr:MAG: hypothetical protein D4R88_06940 [Methanosarcinales archaeon]